MHKCEFFKCKRLATMYYELPSHICWMCARHYDFMRNVYVTEAESDKAWARDVVKRNGWRRGRA